MTIKLFGIEIKITSEPSDETKSRVVENIERSNSREYKMQVANHHFVNSVIDDILADPYWREIAIEAAKSRK